MRFSNLKGGVCFLERTVLLSVESPQEESRVVPTHFAKIASYLGLQSIETTAIALLKKKAG